MNARPSDNMLHVRISLVSTHMDDMHSISLYIYIQTYIHTKYYHENLPNVSDTHQIKFVNSKRHVAYDSDWNVRIYIFMNKFWGILRLQNKNNLKNSILYSCLHASFNIIMCMHGDIVEEFEYYLHIFSQLFFFQVRGIFLWQKLVFLLLTNPH